MVNIIQGVILLIIIFILIVFVKKEPIMYVDKEGNCVEVTEYWDCELHPEKVHKIIRFYKD